MSLSLPALPSPKEQRLAILAEQCRRSYAVFFRTFWEVIEPGTPLVWNWHLQVICDHLQAVTEGRIRNLLICLPPGHAKSVSVSAMWQPWEWIDRPWLRELYGSYDEDLTYRDSLKARDILRSRRYQSLFRPDWSIRRDQDAKGYFQNTLHGSRKTYYMGSRKKTGWRGNHVIVDDPLSAEDRYDRKEKNIVNESFDKVLSTRVNRAEDAAFVVIMQRLSVDDLVGYLIDKYGDKYVQLILRSEYDPGRPCITPIFDERAYRQTAGDLLFPELFPRGVIEDFKIRLGPIDYAAQFQHDPVPDAGNRFDSAKFQYWRWSGPPSLIRIFSRSGASDIVNLDMCPHFIMADIACSEKNEGDFTSIGRYALVPEKNYLILLHRISIQEKEPGVIAALRSMYAMPGFGRMRPMWAGIEANGLGKPIAQAVAGSIPTVEIHISKDKLVMSASAVVHIDGGMFFFPSPDEAPWMNEFTRQLVSFPGGQHDDDVTQISLAANSTYEMSMPQICGGKGGGNQKPQHNAASNRFDAAKSRIFGGGRNGHGR